LILQNSPDGSGHPFLQGEIFCPGKRVERQQTPFFRATKNEEMQKRWERTAGLASKKI